MLLEVEVQRRVSRKIWQKVLGGAEEHDAEHSLTQRCVAPPLANGPAHAPRPCITEKDEAGRQYVEVLAKYGHMYLVLTALYQDT